MVGNNLMRRIREIKGESRKAGLRTIYDNSNASIRTGRDHILELRAITTLGREDI
jgi:hypothetical protein